MLAKEADLAKPPFPGVAEGGSMWAPGHVPLPRHKNAVTAKVAARTRRVVRSSAAYGRDGLEPAIPPPKRPEPTSLHKTALSPSSPQQPPFQPHTDGLTQQPSTNENRKLMAKLKPRAHWTAFAVS
jgi:hypothetical protein